MKRPMEAPVQREQKFRSWAKWCRSWANWRRSWANWLSLYGHDWTLTASQFRSTVSRPTRRKAGARVDEITIVGGGLAGLTPAISRAEAGAPGRLLGRHQELGGRARSLPGPYQAEPA